MSAGARVVYLVASHTNRAQVLRLVRRLRRDSPACRVVVHHDPTHEPLDAAAFAGDARVTVVPDPLRVGWGQFSQVELVLRAIPALLASGEGFDWLVLLSGQDYPIKPLAAFERALAETGDGAIEHDPATALLDRYERAWYRLPRRLEGRASEAVFTRLSRLNGRQPFVRFVSGRVGCRVGLPARRSPFAGGMRAYKGTTWWALSRRCIAYVDAFVRANPDFVAWYRERTIMPDESFFQTILLNAGTFALRNDDGRFVRWEPPGAASPRTLSSADLPALRASPKFFARKLDERADPGVLDRIDAMLG